MEKILMTEETRKHLTENVDLNIDANTKLVDTLNGQIKLIEKVNKFFSKEDISIDWTNLTHLIEYELFLGILILDLSTATKIYLNARFKYEGLFAARQVLIIINEGYKKIYNFVWENENGEIIVKHRNNSFWKKEVSQIITDFPLEKEEYDNLTQQLEKYSEINFEEIKRQRDLSIHYDKNSHKVYRMLQEIDIDETFQKLIPFLDILNRMIKFTNKLMIGYNENIKNKNKEQNNNLYGFIEKLESLKNEQNKALIENAQEMIRNAINKNNNFQSPNR